MPVASLAFPKHVFAAAARRAAAILLVAVSFAPVAARACAASDVEFFAAHVAHYMHHQCREPSFDHEGHAERIFACGWTKIQTPLAAHFSQRGYRSAQQRNACREPVSRASVVRSKISAIIDHDAVHVAPTTCRERDVPVFASLQADWMHHRCREPSFRHGGRPRALLECGWQGINGPERIGQFTSRGYSTPAMRAWCRALVAADRQVALKLHEILLVDTPSSPPRTSLAANRRSLDPSGTSETCPYPAGAPQLAEGHRVVPPDLVDTAYPALPSDCNASEYLARSASIPAYPATATSAAPVRFQNCPPGRNVGPNYGRLKPALREAAARTDPVHSLALSVAAFARGDHALGAAFADLAVTGRSAFERFAAASREQLARAVRAQPLLGGLARDAVARELRRALDRAFRVANVLRIGGTLPSGRESPARAALGWIAVSSEDDPPHRPVNAPTSRYATHSLDVPTRLGTVQTRFVLSLPRAYPSQVPVHALMPSAIPALPEQAKVVLFIHGMDSRAEEGELLAEALRALAPRDPYLVLAFDLPTSGYATRVDPARVSDFADIGRFNTPLLQYIEDFVVSFVDTLDSRLAGRLKPRIAAVAGGSLGGNMGLRLGRRSDLPWIERVVVWNPASIWTSFAYGSDFFKDESLRTTLDLAGRHSDHAQESVEARRDFFDRALIDGSQNVLMFNIVPSQPRMWYRADWPCIETAVVASQVERHEHYHEVFRRWHWRLAAEQLFYSHWNPSQGHELELMRNIKPLLLICGKLDNFKYAEICDATQKAAARMTATPGRALFLEKTGHSVHAERPNWLAAQLRNFIEDR